MPFLMIAAAKLIRRRAAPFRLRSVFSAVVSVGLLVLAAYLVLPTQHDDSSQHQNQRYLLAKRYVRSKDGRTGDAGVDTRPRVPGQPSAEAIERRMKMMGLSVETKMEKENEEKDEEATEETKEEMDQRRQAELVPYTFTPADLHDLPNLEAIEKVMGAIEEAPTEKEEKEEKTEQRLQEALVQYAHTSADRRR